MSKTHQKTLKLKEAHQEQLFNTGIKDMEFWLAETEALMSSDEYGKDLASVESLLKKHNSVEADILAHEERLLDLNNQAKKFIAQGHFDASKIEDKEKSINERYERYRSARILLKSADCSCDQMAVSQQPPM